MDPAALKAMAGRAAVEFLAPSLAADRVIGVGTGSTVEAFLDEVVASKIRLAGAVSSSEATSARLRHIGIDVVDVGSVGRIELYIDGADEIDPVGNMIKGGGGAHTREKIVASMADRFVCLVDESKLVERLGRFPVPLEVIPMAASLVIGRCAALGGRGALRTAGGVPTVTDNGQHIVDVSGLVIGDPLGLELEMSAWPGVVSAGIFARQRASVCLVGTPNGARRIDYDP